MRLTPKTPAQKQADIEAARSAVNEAQKKVDGLRSLLRDAENELHVCKLALSAAHCYYTPVEPEPIDKVQVAMQLLRSGARLVLWRMSSPWNWYLQTSRGEQHPLSSETAKVLLPHCCKEADAKDSVPEYRLGHRRGRDCGLPEWTQYALMS